MTKRSRVGVVSPMTAILPIIDAAFAEVWAEGECVHLVDEGLYRTFADTGDARSEVVIDRLTSLFELSAGAGVDLIAFTGSVFGEAVRRARARVAIPVLTSFEPLIEAAFGAGTRYVVMTTALPSLVLLKEEMESYARERRIELAIDGRVVEGAFRALHEDGDPGAHDRLIAREVEGASLADAILLGQYSMGGAAELLRNSGRTVLTPARCMVAHAKSLLERSA